MKHNHTKREKGQALFLAALMVLSVFAMSASFAGAAAADGHTITGEVTDTDGEAIVDADVTAIGADEVETSTTTAQDGTYTLEVGTDQDYDVTAGAEGSVSATATVASDDFSAENEAEQNFELDAPSTVFNDQVSDDGMTVTVDEVYLPEDGFVAIHSTPVEDEDAGISPADSVVGVSEPLDAGDHTDVEVMLFGDNVVGADFDRDSLEESQTLVAMPHLDEPNDDEYRFVETFNDDEQEVEDIPFFDQEGNILGMDEASVTAGGDEIVAESEIDGDLFWAGQHVLVTGLDSNEDVQLREDTGDSSSLVAELTTNDEGEVLVDTSDLEGDYFLQGASANGNNFEVAEQSLDAEFDSESVDADGSTELLIDSQRGTYDVEVSAEDLDGEDLEGVFGAENVAEVHDDSVIIENADGAHNADFSAVAAGDYNFTVDVTDSDAEDMAMISVGEEVDADAQFDSSTYSQTAGDMVEFTVEMEGTDSTVVSLEEDSENYWADLHVEADDGEDEVTVWFNTYEAGQHDIGAEEDGEHPAFSAENGSVEVLDERDLTDGDFRLLPGDFGLELYVGDESTIGNQEAAGDNDERLDLDNLEEVDVASLILTERSTGDVEPGVAPADSEIENADDIDNVTTSGSDVAEDDLQIIGFDINGIFGLFDGDDLTAADINDSDYFDVEIEHTNPAQYQSANDIDLSDVDVITDSENDRMFFVIDTSQNDISADQNYDVTLTVNEEYYDMDDDEEAMTSFSVVERMIEVTGEWDDDERLQVENSAEANVTGESTAAPGSDVQIRLRATGDDPFLMTESAEVDENGVIDASFDLSDHEEGQNFTVRMTDQHDNDVQDEVDAVLVESTYEQDPHTVTITVEDADGNAVEGAEVEVDGQTETTDANGEAVFELAHGEYDISATYDGEEATGTLTVDDETSDSGTLTLGEEDQQIPEEDPADENGDTDPSDENGDVDPDDENGDADPDDEEDPEDEDQPGFGIAVALIALLAAAGIALRNRA